MANYNREMAQRVWQRVQAAQPDPPVVPPKHTDALQSLIVEEWQIAQIYGYLSKTLQGKPGKLMGRLQEEKRAQVACLKGLYTMISGTKPELHGIRPQKEPIPMLLRRCYGVQMRCMSRYETRENEPEYGAVYSRLAQQNKDHCRRILELLGSIQ